MTSAVLRFLGKAAAAASLLALAVASPAQTARRIVGIDTHQQTTLSGSRHPLALSTPSTGRLDAATRLSGVTLHFNMTAAQQADLQALLAAQQNPSSAQYHRWLTPAQYAARFGVSDADLSTVSSWLQQQGFAVQGPNASHTQLSFSGTAAQVEQAFSTRLSTYNVAGRSVYAPSQDLVLPTAVASMIHGVGNLSSFRPRAHHHPMPRFTSTVSGNHYVAPDDFTTIYDIKPLYNAGYTGSGITIAVVGQTAIATTDVSAFRTAAGLPAATPTFTLVPNSGVSTEAGGADEEESDLDVEWSGAIAKNAAINFIYVGNNTNFSVFDSLQYAIDNNVAPIISMSYGGCETSYTSADIGTIQSWLAQANAQGQTVIAASGDSAAADCDFSTSTTTVTSATHGLAVDLPGSFPYVTSIGGTEFSGDVSSPSTYWSSSNNASNGSALLYIPEQAWNDTSTSNGLEGGGGGVSVVFGEPSWQTGTGVPSNAGRNVPDLALAGSPNHDGYLYCSVGSCSNGFRDASNNLTVAGGTSFGAPTFSGILALIEQQLASKGLGNVNPTLYSIAASAPTAFHDITTGSNIVPCTAGSADCGTSGTLGYSAGPGYDQVTGLGTPDANVLAAAFKTASSGGGGSALIATSTVLITSLAAPTPAANITYTATITANNGSGTPTGTVQFAVDGTNSGSPVPLASGAATFTTSFPAIGSHTITATYSGDSTHSGSSSTLASNVANLGGFTMSATAVTVKQGASGTSTITVTPSGGFTGAITFTASAPANLTNACYTITNATVTGATPATATMTLYTTESACTTAGSRRLVQTQAKATGDGRSGLTVLYAGLFPLLCLTGIRRRRTGWTSMALVVCAAGTLLWLSGCGGGGSSSTSTPKGTYAIGLTGTNSAGTLSNTATVNLTVN